jgi:hypothetical protein
MSTVEEQAAMEDQPEEQPEETEVERIARERLSLIEAGVLPVPLEISRATFDTMQPSERAAFLSRGWRVIDDPITRSAPAPLQKGEVRRSTFAAMSSSEQMDFVRGGGKVADD